jgi:hypothetical protein
MIYVKTAALCKVCVNARTGRRSEKKDKRKSFEEEDRMKMEENIKRLNKRVRK